MKRAIFCLMALSILAVRPAAAQAPNPSERITIDTSSLLAWRYMITGTLPASFAQPSGTTIEVRLDDQPAELTNQMPGNPLIDPTTKRFTLWLKHPLHQNQSVRVRPVRGSDQGGWSEEAVVQQPDNDCPTPVSDCRSAFEASAYIGLGIDTFAAGETIKYLNPNAPNGPQGAPRGRPGFCLSPHGTPGS